MSISVYEVLGALPIVFLGGTLIFFFRRYGKLHVSSIEALSVYLWHTLFSIVYLLYVREKGGDALIYYKHSLNFDLESFQPGTEFINFLVYVMAGVLKFSIESCFMVFNLIGALGLLFFLDVMKNNIRYKKEVLVVLVYIIAFLPSVSFWTSAIGKDSVAFLSTGMALWASLHLRSRIRFMFAAIILMLMIRPHIGLVMLGALACVFFFDSKVSNLKRVVLVVASLVVIAPLVPAVLNYAGVQEHSISGILSYIENRQGYNMDGGGGVDISQMSLPGKLFTYVYRPIVFEARSLYELAAALDNLVLLLLTLFAALSYVIYGKKSMTLDRGSAIFMASFAIGCLLILATTTANLGISIRQKWMFMPMVIVLLLSVLPSRRIIVRNNSQPVC